jgi:hypothetical protein
MLKKKIIQIFIIAAILLFCLIIILIFFKFKVKLNSNLNEIKIIFNSALETRQFILNDTDNYIKNMSKVDLIARNVNSNYLLNAANDTLSFSPEEKWVLIEMMKNVNKIINELRFKINIVKFSKVGNIYENGYPHTRYNIIFLSQSFFEKLGTANVANAINILKHECIHIYQRYNPLSTEKYLNMNGYKKIGNFKSLFPKEYLLKRSNSDIDDNIWQDANGQLMFPIFSSNNPQSLSDLHCDKKMEHPYEWMAYHLEES